MELSDGERQGLNTALAEATCLGITVEEASAKVEIQLEVLTLAVDGETPPPRRKVALVLDGVGRLAASMRTLKWNQTQPTVQPLTIDGLSDAVRSFGGGRLHGWEFIDLPESSWATWSGLLSLDCVLSEGPTPHVLDMFQEEGIRPDELDLRIWFDDLRIVDEAGHEIPLTDFIDGGKRWWYAHDHNDPRAVASDIAPPL